MNTSSTINIFCLNGSDIVSISISGSNVSVLVFVFVLVVLVFLGLREGHGRCLA